MIRRKRRAALARILQTQLDERTVAGKADTHLDAKG